MLIKFCEVRKIKFHEDAIFKNNGEIYGQDLIEIVNIKGELIKLHQTESSIIDPKMYKPDLIMELKDKIIIFEFQSTRVDTRDKRRFRFYTALFDHVKIKSKKPIEVHVLSTIEKEQVKWYNVSSQARFLIYIHSLKNINGDKLINSMNTKIGNNQKLTTKDLLMISLLCFMESEKSLDINILNSAVTITNIPDLNEDIGQFVKGVVLMLCDKFVKDKSLNTTISNIVGGNMKIVEDYAQRVAKRKVDEKLEEIVINLRKKGFSIDEIVETVEVSLDFVKKTLSKYFFFNRFFLELFSGSQIESKGLFQVVLYEDC